MRSFIQGMICFILFYNANTFSEESPSVLLAYNTDINTIHVTFSDTADAEMSAFFGGMFFGVIGIALSDRSYKIHSHTTQQPDNFSLLKDKYLEKIVSLLKTELGTQDIETIKYNPSKNLDDLVRAHPLKNIYLLNTLPNNNKVYTPFAINTALTLDGLVSTIGIGFSIEEVTFNTEDIKTNTPGNYIAEKVYEPRYHTKKSKVHKCFKKVVFDKEKIKNEHIQDIKENGYSQEEMEDDEILSNDHIISMEERITIEQLKPSKFSSRSQAVHNCTKKHLSHFIKNLSIQHISMDGSESEKAFY